MTAAEASKDKETGAADPEKRAAAKTSSTTRRRTKTDGAKAATDTKSPRAAAKPKPKATTKASSSAKSRRVSRRASKSASEVAHQTQASPQPRILVKLREEATPVLTREFGYTSPMQVPRLKQIVLNIGIGAEALENARAIENAAQDLALISGQHPVTTRSRKSIANFKLREGMPVGLRVTLRGRRMYEFYDRLTSSSLPRIRDFRGVSRNSFDGRGNYALGIREQVIFPEIDYNSIDRIRGLQIIIGTTASTDREGLRLLELLGMPFAQIDTASKVA